MQGFWPIGVLQKMRKSRNPLLSDLPSIQFPFRRKVSVPFYENFSIQYCHSIISKYVTNEEHKVFTSPPVYIYISTLLAEIQRLLLVGWPNAQSHGNMHLLVVVERMVN